MKNILAFILIFIASTVQALDKSQVKEKWHTPFDLYLSPQEAYEMKTNNPKGILMVDVRNQQELHYIGMADSVDVNIPYQFDSSKWKMKSDGIHGIWTKEDNHNFLPALQNALTAHGLTKENPLIIICTSGTRAPWVADDLYYEDFKKVYTTINGFEGIKSKDKSSKNYGHRVVNGWKNNGLPWSYKLPDKKMYHHYDPEIVGTLKPKVTKIKDILKKEKQKQIDEECE